MRWAVRAGDRLAHDGKGRRVTRPKHLRPLGGTKTATPGTVTDPTGTNPYTDAGNNPVIDTELTGREAIEDLLGLVAITGTSVAGIVTISTVAGGIAAASVCPAAGYPLGTHQYEAPGSSEEVMYDFRPAAP